MARLLQSKEDFQMSSSLRILCLSSSTPKGGSTVKYALDSITSGALPNAQFVALATTRPDAGVRTLALRSGMTAAQMVTLPPSSAGENALADAILDSCERYDVNLIWQSGWTRMTPTRVVEKLRGRIINQHGGGLNPGKFVAGKHVDFGGSGMKGRATFAAEFNYLRATGRTHGWAVSHFVDEGLDTGRVIRAWKVPLLQDDAFDTYVARKGPIEKAVQAATLGDFASHGRVTTIEPEGIAVTLTEQHMLWEARTRAIAEYSNG